MVANVHALRHYPGASHGLGPMSDSLGHSLKGIA
jgi:hypothetical protein